MGLPWVTHVFGVLIHGSPSPGLWIARESPTGCPWVSHGVSNGSPMGHSGVCHGFTMGRAWIQCWRIHPRVWSAGPWVTRRWSMGRPWVIYVLVPARGSPMIPLSSPMVLPWLCDGSPMDSHDSVFRGIPTGLPKKDKIMYTTRPEALYKCCSVS